MAYERSEAVLHHLHTLFNVGSVAGLTDGQLLEQFASRRGEVGEVAFTALVERHGPMVLRRALGSSATTTTPKTLFRRRSSSWRGKVGRSGCETRWGRGFIGSPVVPQLGSGLPRIVIG